MTTTTFAERIEIARQAENKVMGMLFWNSVPVYRTGQENWLPEWIHSKLRYKHEAPISLIKHFPDLATNGALIQVKCAPESNNYEYVTLETESYDNSKLLSDCGVPVLIVWLLQDQSLKGQWVSDLMITEPATPREETNGSHTPFCKVLKAQLQPFKEFLKLLRG